MGDFFAQIVADGDGFGDAELAAEAGGGHAGLFAEDGGEADGGVEAGAVGDGGHGEVGVDEHFADTVEAGAADFFEGAAAEDGAEFSFEAAAGDLRGADDIADADAVAGVVADVADGGGEFGVGDGEDVGALARDDFLGGDEDGFGRRRFAVEQVVEEGGGFVADAFRGDGDAGEGGGGEEADHGVVVDADDGDGFGDGDVEVAADFEDGPGDGVGGGEEGERAGEGAEPLGDGVVGDGAVHLAVGHPAGHGAVVEFFLGEFGGESLFAFPGEVHVEGVDEGEVGEAAVEEVAGSDLADAAVVGADAGDAGVGVAVGDVDGVDVAGVEGVGDFLEDERADNAVEVIDACAGEFFGIAFEHVEDPRAGGACIGDDAAHDSACIFIVKFQCNANMH